MKKQFKIGDRVEVLDGGLLMLQQFAPKGARPNNLGIIEEIYEDGEILIAFPIGDDPMEEHSQVVPYSRNLVRHKEWE